MQYRQLGTSGLRVSPLCLGTMNFGGPTDAADAARIIAASRDAGINFIDTANVYTEGRSEQITGDAIRPHRSHWILATKVNGATGTGPNDRGSSRKAIMDAAHASLKRLATDYIDVYYLHREDLATPLAESVRAMADLQRSGAIRYFAVSNHKSWRVAEICRIADDLGIDRPIASQPYYNAMNRTLEIEHLPACAHFGLGVVPYSPVARGVLTAKYDHNAPPPPDSRAARQDRRIMQTEYRTESIEIAKTLQTHAIVRGITPGQFATAWVLNNRLVTSVIAGPRTEAHLHDYLGALDYGFTTEDEALVDRLVPPGHASTPFYSDPSDPVQGRRPSNAGTTS